MKQDSENKAKFYKKTKHIFTAITVTGLVMLGSEICRLGKNIATGPPQLSQEYTTLKDNSYRLEADRQTLSTELTADYPLVTDKNFFGYINGRVSFLKQNEILMQQTQQELSTLTEDIDALAQYKSNNGLSRYVPIGFSLYILGLMGGTITSNKRKKYKRGQPLEKQLD